MEKYSKKIQIEIRRYIAIVLAITMLPFHSVTTYAEKAEEAAKKEVSSVSASSVSDNIQNVIAQEM